MLRSVSVFILTCCFSLLTPPGRAALAAVDPAGLIPVQIALPEPWWMLKLLLLLTFFIHIVLVNVVLGGSFMALVGSLRQKEAIPFNLKRESSYLTKTLAMAVNFGVAPYLFMQVLYGSFFYSSTLLLSVWWMSVVGMVMLAYYALYIVSDSAAQGMAAARPLLAAIVLMFSFTAFVLSNNSTLMLRPENWEGWLTRPFGTLLNTGDPAFLPRYLHFLVASVAVGGLTLAFRAKWNLGRAGADPALAADNIRNGLAWFRYATLVQALVGLWFFLMLPAPVRQLFLGGSAVATVTLLLAVQGLLTVLFLAWSGRVYETCAATLGLIFVMVTVRDIVRDAMLLPYLDIRETAAEAAEKAGSALALDQGQHLAFAFFLFCLLLALAIMAWLARVGLRAMRAAREAELAEAHAAGAKED